MFNSTGGDARIVILDLNMPNLDGHGAARSIRNQGYSGPILALSAGKKKRFKGKFSLLI